MAGFDPVQQRESDACFVAQGCKSDILGMAQGHDPGQRSGIDRPPGVGQDWRARARLAMKQRQVETIGQGTNEGYVARRRRFGRHVHRRLPRRRGDRRGRACGRCRARRTIPSRAIVAAVVEGLARSARPPAAVSYFGHGTTVATNALIQHRGAPTGLITTAGFRDLLEIGRQRRPHLYDLQADKPPRARAARAPHRGGRAPPPRRAGRDAARRGRGARGGRACSDRRVRGRSPSASSTPTSTRATSDASAGSWRRSARRPS